MSIIQILFSHDLVYAWLVYLFSILTLMPLFEWIHRALNHAVLQWCWDQV